MPIMVSEFLIGRHSRANTARAYQKLAPGTHWRWVGRMGVLAGFLILSYYSVVAGWTLEYIIEAVTNRFAGKTPDEFISSFQAFSSSPWRPILWLTLFLLGTHFIIVKGVEKGIEKSSKIMMPPTIYHYSYSGSMFGFFAGCKQRDRVSAKTGFQQSKRECIPKRHGASFLLP